MAPTILVTGATSGFGHAISRLFGSQGWNLIITGRRESRLAELKNTLESSSSSGKKVKVLPLAFDVRNRASVEASLGSIPEEFRKIDALVNNAGLSLGLDPAQKASLEDWEEMVDTNIKGLMYVTRAILPGMVERNSGTIVNMGSVAANYPYPGGNAYGGTKAFVKQFSLNLRADLLGSKVRVCCLEPGLAETEFSLVRFKGDEEKAKAPYAGLKPLVAEDLAEIVRWVVTLPPHVNINTMEIMPVQQAFSPFSFDRKK